jgi:ribosomal protein S18 acetylase RimI-like enzyme
MSMSDEDPLAKYKIVREPRPAQADVESIEAILNQQNQAVGLNWSPEPLSVIMQDEGGNVVGGLIGSTNWGWLHVNALAVAPDLREVGAGSKLMREAEAIARERGCKFGYLDTFSFQALGFYEKLDYVVYGVLDDFPTGAQRYFLKKQL